MNESSSSIMLEDDKTLEIRKRVNLDPKGYSILTKDELSYFFTRTVYWHEQEKIQIVYGWKIQEELAIETRKIAKKTAGLVYVTWVLVVINILSMLPYNVLNYLKYLFSRY